MLIDSQLCHPSGANSVFGIPVLHGSLGGSRGICLAVGREWENFMALSLHEPEITLR